MDKWMQLAKDLEGSCHGLIEVGLLPHTFFEWLRTNTRKHRKAFVDADIPGEHSHTRLLPVRQTAPSVTECSQQASRGYRSVTSWSIAVTGHYHRRANYWLRSAIIGHVNAQIPVSACITSTEVRIGPHFWITQCRVPNDRCWCHCNGYI